MKFERSTLMELLSDINILNVKEKIIEILEILYKDKDEVDDEVNLAIKKLRCIDEKDLKTLEIFGYNDEKKLIDVFNKIMSFDINFSRSDYENCIFYETGDKLKDMLNANNMTDKQLYVFANYNYAKEIINNAKDDFFEKLHHKI